MQCWAWFCWRNWFLNVPIRIAYHIIPLHPPYLDQMYFLHYLLAQRKRKVYWQCIHWQWRRYARTYLLFQNGFLPINLSRSSSYSSLSFSACTSRSPPAAPPLMMSSARVLPPSFLSKPFHFRQICWNSKQWIASQTNRPLQINQTSTTYTISPSPNVPRKTLYFCMSYSSPGSWSYK